MSISCIQCSKDKSSGRRHCHGPEYVNCGIANELQIAKFASDERLTFTDIRRYSGSVMELKKKAEQYIIDAMDWRVEFGNLTRREIPEIPLDAIREAITNSFGHRMFDSGQSNEITIFKNRIEIYNPGAFPANKTPESYVMGNQRPIRRNPLIARTLYYSKDMESFATGLKRIKDTCDRVGCRVEFETLDDGFVVIFYRHGFQKLSGTAQKTAQKQEKTAQKQEKINALLEYCKEPRDRDEMMKFLGIKHRTTFRSDYLIPLLNDGKIVMTMPDKPRSKNQKFYSV